jgi:hypothetical protein
MDGDEADLARWRELFEVRDGVLYWRKDPNQSAGWNAHWGGQPTGARVRFDGRRFTSTRIATAIETGILPSDGKFASAWDTQIRLPPGVAVGAGPLIKAIDAACAETGMTRRDLAVLTPQARSLPHRHAGRAWARAVAQSPIRAAARSGAAHPLARRPLRARRRRRRHQAQRRAVPEHDRRLFLADHHLRQSGEVARLRRCRPHRRQTQRRAGHLSSD